MDWFHSRIFRVLAQQGEVGMVDNIIRKIFHYVKVYNEKQGYVGTIIIETDDEDLVIMPQNNLVTVTEINDQRNIQSSTTVSPDTDEEVLRHG